MDTIITTSMVNIHSPALIRTRVKEKLNGKSLDENPIENVLR